MYKKAETCLHFVGIGGIGMSGIAEVFLNQGYPISGSDLVESETTQRLEHLGARIYLGHSRENIQNAHVVIISSAIHSENPEVQAAKERRIPVIPRAEMLGELMRGKVGIAVAGTHGKTTTTSMLANILTVADMDPTLVIGGKVDSLGGGSAKLGQGNYVVVEADESDGSFLHLPAMFAIVTNIDNDHLDYFGSLEAVEDVFVQFMSKLPFYGVAAVCGEDPGVRRCLARWTKPYQTYGFSEEWDIFATEIQYHRIGSEFTLRVKSPTTHEVTQHGRIRLSVPGKHNILNALGAISIAMRLKIPFDVISRGLLNFRGVKRRFDIRWQHPKGQCAIVDDYAHHPTEIAATLAAARNFWSGRIISIFQPHRYTRTLHCQSEFRPVFSKSDVVFITDIYSAGETPIPGIDGAFLAKQFVHQGYPEDKVFATGDLAATRIKVQEYFRPGDCILCLGAGSITRLAEQLVEDFKNSLGEPS